jgi:hypothetical protein
MNKKKWLPRKGPKMATSAPVRRKTAEDELLEGFGQLIDSASEKLSHKEFMKAAKRANNALDQAIDAHSRQRDTA